MKQTNKKEQIKKQKLIEERFHPRYKNKVTLSIHKREIIFLLIIYITAAIYLLYFSPACGRGRPHRTIQLIPLKTIISQLLTPRGLDNLLGNLIGNIVILLPVGLALSVLCKTKNKLRPLLFFMGLAVVIELFQFILSVGCLDIDDIWMNGLGGFIGWKLGKRVIDFSVDIDNPVNMKKQENKNSVPL